MGDEPRSLSLLQNLGIAACVVAFAMLVFGSIIGSAWFLPWPWYLCGAIPATAIYWILQRDSVVETVVIFLILLLCCWAIRLPIQRFREYIDSDSNPKAAVADSRCNASADVG